MEHYKHELQQIEVSMSDKFKPERLLSAKEMTLIDAEVIFLVGAVFCFFKLVKLCGCGACRSKLGHHFAGGWAWWWCRERRERCRAVFVRVPVCTFKSSLCVPSKTRAWEHEVVKTWSALLSDGGDEQSRARE